MTDSDVCRERLLDALSALQYLYDQVYDRISDETECVVLGALYEAKMVAFGTPPDKTTDAEAYDVWMVDMEDAVDARTKQLVSKEKARRLGKRARALAQARSRSYADLQWREFVGQHTELNDLEDPDA